MIPVSEGQITPRGKTFEIYYAKDLSVNHYRGRRADGREFVKSDVKAWKDALGWTIKVYHVEDWNLPLTVSCKAVFPDKIKRDSHNLSKCVLDAIQEVTGIDDSNMLWHDEPPRMAQLYEEPKLIITISEAP